MKTCFLALLALRARASPPAMRDKRMPHLGGVCRVPRGDVADTIQSKELGQWRKKKGRMQSAEVRPLGPFGTNGKSEN